MNLKEIRISKGLKQNKVAKDLGINTVTYNGYETGKSEPNIEIILKLADYFNVSTDELLGMENNKPILSERKILLDKIKDLSENECFKLSVYADALKAERITQKK